MSINQVAISGNLTRDPELKASSGGTEITKFGVAVEQSYKDANGDWQTKAHFVDCTMFGGRGRVLADKAVKGDLVHVGGRLDFSQWETESGDKRSKLEVVANEVGGDWQYRKAGEKPASSEVAPESAGSDDDIPF